MKITLARKSETVELETSEGIVLMYSVKEMTGAQRDSYFSKMSTKTKQGGDQVTITDFNGLYSTLLSHTLYDDKDKLVEEKIIQSWPDSAQKALFTMAKKLNGLDDSDKDPKKD
jgi:hypothetical protein